MPFEGAAYAFGDRARFMLKREHQKRLISDHGIGEMMITKFARSPDRHRNKAMYR